MKITRLKRGYVIRSSDTEFSLLSGFVSDGIDTYQGDEDAYARIPPAEKAAWTRRERGGGLMRVDEDRRGTSEVQP